MTEIFKLKEDEEKNEMKAIFKNLSKEMLMEDQMHIIFSNKGIRIKAISKNRARTYDILLPKQYFEIYNSSDEVIHIKSKDFYKIFSAIDNTKKGDTIILTSDSSYLRFKDGYGTNFHMRVDSGTIPNFHTLDTSINVSDIVIKKLKEVLVQFNNIDVEADTFTLRLKDNSLQLSISEELGGMKGGNVSLGCSVNGDFNVMTTLLTEHLDPLKGYLSSAAEVEINLIDEDGAAVAFEFIYPHGSYGIMQIKSGSIPT